MVKGLLNYIMVKGLYFFKVGPNLNNSDGNPSIWGPGTRPGPRADEMFRFVGPTPGSRALF